MASIKKARHDNHERADEKSENGKQLPSGFVVVTPAIGQDLADGSISSTALLP